MDKYKTICTTIWILSLSWAAGWLFVPHMVLHANAQDCLTCLYVGVIGGIIGMLSGTAVLVVGSEA